jgi:DNA-binding CsgD family transcriptional regulator
MPCQPLTITLSNTDQQALEKLANRPSTPQQIAQRARIVLKGAEGKNNAEIARTLDISIKMVRQWRHRWVNTNEQSKTVSRPKTFAIAHRVIPIKPMIVKKPYS